MPSERAWGVRESSYSGGNDLQPPNDFAEYDNCVENLDFSFGPMELHMAGQVKTVAIALALSVTITSASGLASAQSPQARVNSSPSQGARVSDDEYPYPDVPPIGGAPLVSPEQSEQPFAFAPPPGPSAIAALGALNGSGFAGVSASLGATRGSYSAAPNMIGDLFNAGTSSLNFQAQFSVSPEFSNLGTPGGLAIPSANALFNGINAPIDSVSVTSLSRIGDLVDIGDNTSISVSDLSPINSVTVQVRTLSDANAVVAGNPSGPVVRPTAPTSNGLIFAAANRAIAEEFSSAFSSDVNVEDFVTLQYLEDDSEITSFNGELNSLSYVYNASVSLPVPSPGEVVGRYSIADNNSPLPQNRLFLDYNFFHNARITAAGIPVSRWAPGFESTFADGLASIEFRAPMAVTLTSAINTSGDDLAAYEFGDISFVLKGLLFQDERFIASAGLGVTIPTADDFSLTLKNNVKVVRVENQSVHLLPFVAGSLYITPDTFVQSFLQFDFDANGNRVFLDEQGFQLQGEGELANVGRLKSQSTIRFSNSVGCFLVRNRKKRISDLAAVLEAHYTGTLNKSDSVGSANFAVGDPTRTLNVLNLTSGLHAYMGKSIVTAAYGVPVTEDRVFDGELRLFFNRYF